MHPSSTLTVSMKPFRPSPANVVALVLRVSFMSPGTFCKGPVIDNVMLERITARFADTLSETATRGPNDGVHFIGTESAGQPRRAGVSNSRSVGPV